MNVVLVPALFLLLALVVYKKVIEPRRGTQKSDAKKVGAKRRPIEATPKAKPKRKEKARAMPMGSGRPGSVL